MRHPVRPRESTRIDAIGIKPPPAFTIEATTTATGISVLALRGELDMAAAASIRALVDAAGTPGLVLGLEGVTFVDSSALRELLHARVVLAERGGGLVLAAVPRIVTRLLEITGTSELFRTAADVDAAVAAVTPPER
jgi:anti-anti-sigma factor